MQIKLQKIKSYSQLNQTPLINHVDTGARAIPWLSQYHIDNLVVTVNRYFENTPPKK